MAEALAAVVKDKEACRATLLRALRGRPRRAKFLFNALRSLGITSDDQEAFDAAREGWSEFKASPYYQRDEWATSMIETFPQQPEVRALARDEMMRRDVAVGAIAKSYADDTEITSRLLSVLAPMPEESRDHLVSALQLAATYSDDALAALDAARADTDGAISFEATVGWVEGMVARGTFDTQHVEALVTELGALGRIYEARRAAAVAGLAIVGHLDRFAAATDHKGDPLNVTMSRASVYGDGRYLRRFLARWDELVRALGGEAQVLDRLQITHDDTLPLLEQSYPNAKRLFDLLIGMTPSSPHSLKYVPMSATARFAPNGERMRSMIVRALTTPNSQYWERLIASEIFAEHFSDDTDLRRQVEEQLVRNPQGAGASALAELVLRRPDLELEKLLREKTSGVNYDVATHFKLVAALSKPRCVIEELEKVLTSDLREIYKWHFPRWIPAIIRRIEKDSVVKDLLNAAMTPDASASVKASFVSLLSQASGVDERLRAFAVRELSRTESEGLPEAGFDLVSQTYRLVRQVLNETIR